MMMTKLKIDQSSQFKKDLKKSIKQKRDLSKLETVINLLQKMEKLPLKYRDHNIIGNWNGHRECHLEPDWLLIYKIEKELELLNLVRTGSHSELFK
jgi:mRNA interferase YafQ